MLGRKFALLCLTLSLFATPALAGDYISGTNVIDGQHVSLVPLNDPRLDVNVVPFSGPDNQSRNYQSNDQRFDKRGFDDRRPDNQTQAPNQLTDRERFKQRQIEEGFRLGALTAEEAARLERGEAHINRQEAADLSNGKLANGERVRLDADLNAEERRIEALSNNNISGNPDSPSAERMEADIPHDINEEQRIDRGSDDGRLTAAEVGTVETRAATGGFANDRERMRIQHAQNMQNATIIFDANGARLEDAFNAALNVGFVTTVASNNVANVGANTGQAHPMSRPAKRLCVAVHRAGKR